VPEELTSPVAEYTVVLAFSVADVKYKAALKTSAVVAARMGATPKLWVAVRISPKNEVHIAWVLAMIFPYTKDAASAAIGGVFFRATWADLCTNSPSNQYSTQVVYSLSLSTTPSFFSSKESSISPLVVVTINLNS
jgi:hypothetical protein